MKHNKKVSKSILSDKATGELKAILNGVEEPVEEIKLAKMIYDSTTQENEQSINIRIEFSGLSEEEVKIIDMGTLNEMVRLAYKEINRLIDLRLGINNNKDESKGEK